MSVKITKMRFMQFGKKAPNSRYKGTLNSESLSGEHGFVDYLSRDEAKQDTKELKTDSSGYIDYTSSHHYQHTMSSFGMITNDDERKHLKKELSKSFRKDGDFFYEAVISLSSHEEAEKYHLKDVENWSKVFNENLPKVFRKKGFVPDNMIWFADLHVNTGHPHVHLVFLEKEHTIDRAKFKKEDLEYLKRSLYSAMAAREELANKERKKYEDVFKEKDIKLKSLVTKIDSYLDKDDISLNDLRKILPTTGRLQYNSQNMKPYKTLLDKYTDQLINNNSDIKNMFDDWIKDLDLLEKNLNEVSGTDIATIKETELNKFYAQIGNKVLKDLREKEPLHKEKVALLPPPSINKQSDPIRNNSSQRYFTVNIGNIKDEMDDIYIVRVPDTMGNDYIYIPKKNTKEHGESTLLVTINDKTVMEHYTMANKEKTNWDAKEIFTYFKERKESEITIKDKEKSISIKSKKSANKTSDKERNIIRSYFSINEGNIENETNKHYYVRVPNTKGQMYMYIPKKNTKKIGDETIQVVVNKKDKFRVINVNSGTETKWDEDRIFNYFDRKKSEEIKEEALLKHKYKSRKVMNKLRKLNNLKVFKLTDALMTKYTYQVVSEQQKIAEENLRMYEENLREKEYEFNTSTSL